MFGKIVWKIAKIKNSNYSMASLAVTQREVVDDRLEDRLEASIESSFPFTSWPLVVNEQACSFNDNGMRMVPGQI